MFLAVAAMVLNVLLTRLTEQQRVVIGTLKSLGYSDRTVFWHLLKFGLGVGLAGGLLGAAGGYALSAGLTQVYRGFFQFPDFGNRFYPWSHAGGLLVSLLCAAAGSLQGARAVLRLRPAQAMRPEAPRRGGAIFIERFQGLWRSLGSGWRMVLRNVFRNRLRTTAATFAAAMGASVLVNASMMADSPRYLIDFQFRKVLRSDVDLTFKDELGEDALHEAARLPGVDRAEPLLSVSCTFVHGPHRKKGAITGLARGSRMTVPRDVRGQAVRIPDAALAMSGKMAAILHVGPGDTVTIEPIKGLKRPRKVLVGEISEGYLGTAVYAEIRYLSRLVDEDFAMTGVELATDGNPARRAALYAELKQLPALQSMAARLDVIKGLEETVLRNQWIVIRILETFAGIVFFGSILNSSLVSLAERQRELATLRVLGYGPWQVGNLLLCETMITTLAGTVLGMPLGYLLTCWVAMAYNSEMFRLPVVTSQETWIGALLLAVGFALLAHLVIQRAIHRMDWLDALKAQE
jgi:putative ABC transport system permease protein